MPVSRKKISQAAIQEVVSQAFQLDKTFSAQGVWFEESLDDQNRTILALKCNHNGQIRTIASIVVS